MDKLDLQEEDGKILIAPHGNLNASLVERVWDQTRKRIEKTAPGLVVVDGSDLSACDGAGIAFLLDLKEKQESLGGQFELENFPPDMLELYKHNSLRCDVCLPAKVSLFRKIAEDTGSAVYGLLVEVKNEVAFLGELVYCTATAFTHPSRIRWGEFLILVEKAGANGVAITALLGFLIGLILAFQSAIALRMFGAEVYVSDLVVLSMFRELGPLITAFIVTSRSGSAYAAELGTMKVNEELDALQTFGLDPMRSLVVPRVFALVIMLPVLTMFNNLFSLLGAELVMVGLGFSPVMFWDHVTSTAGLEDLFGGILKTFVFGFLIGSIGCSKGIQTGRGASAVGDAATKAVVSSLVMLVVVDFIFAIVYYSLGI